MSYPKEAVNCAICHLKTLRKIKLVAHEKKEHSVRLNSKCLKCDLRNPHVFITCYSTDSRAKLLNNSQNLKCNIEPYLNSKNYYKILKYSGNALSVSIKLLICQLRIIRLNIQISHQLLTIKILVKKQLLFQL